MEFQSSQNIKKKTTHLYKSRERGGLGLPCFLHHYWAANLRALVYWQDGYIMEVSRDTPAWVAIEKKSVINSSLPALLFSAPGLPANTKLHNRIILNSLKSWQQIRKNCAFPDTIIHAPIYRNHAFLPSLSDAAFESWRQKGIVTIKDLYIICCILPIKRKVLYSINTFFLGVYKLGTMSARIYLTLSISLKKKGAIRFCWAQQIQKI